MKYISHSAWTDAQGTEAPGTLRTRSNSATSWKGRIARFLKSAIAGIPLLLASPSEASTAYGSLNNFDCVNDTGSEAHGFDIELEDIHSRDITYTYDWNHYGTPRITEDLTDPLHPRVLIRYAATRQPNGTWSTYTAIPSGPISPTDGHQFTDPSVNFGGEHFGAGYYGNPTAVRYFWLVDDGAGNLMRGQPVSVATPTFVYYPPAPAQPVPVVQAVIVPPPPPVQPALQFGQAVWVKDIKTKTHNANKIKLVELRDPDPNDPSKKDWANGEPAEVETEWRIMQTEFGNDGNPKGELKGLPQEMAEGNEVITRRYEFYKYTGPIDVESGEAMSDEVAADGIHGVGSVTYNSSFLAGEPVESTVDLSTMVVVGDFIGAQMSGFDVAPALGLIDHIPDGEVGVDYAERSVVIAAGAPFFATITGTLPDGTTLDPVTGIFSGKPNTAGVFNFNVEATDLSGIIVTQAYTVTITGDAPPATANITVESSPANGGVTTGGGTYTLGDLATLSASPSPGYQFLNWTESGVEISADASITIAVDGDHTLVANFTQASYTITTASSPANGGTTTGGGSYNDGDSVTVSATASAGFQFVNWTENGASVSASAAYMFSAAGNRSLVANFARISYAITTASSPANGGTTTGGGSYNDGDSVTVSATASAGFQFVNWTENGASVSASAAYMFSAAGNRSLVANFARISYAITTAASPIIGGTTTGGGSYNDGDSVTVSATASAGFQFVNWTENGASVSASAAYTFPAMGNRSLVANFARISYAITTAASPNIGGTTTGGGSYNDGDSVTVSATASAGFQFVNWTENGASVSASASYTFSATGNRSLVANFIATTTDSQLKRLELPSKVESKHRETGEIKLVTPAPAGGVVVLLSSSNPTVLSVPTSVFIPAGKTSASFVVRGASVQKRTAVKVTATLGTSVLTKSVTVIPD